MTTLDAFEVLHALDTLPQEPNPRPLTEEEAAVLRAQMLRLAQSYE